MKDEVHIDFETSDAELFPIYAAEVERVLGMNGAATDSERDRKDNPNELLQQPTPGER